MEKLLKKLDELNIEYKLVNHDAVYTAEEAQKIKLDIDGVGCKNLFLKSKTNFYLYLVEDNKKANLKELSNSLEESKLTFATEEELYNKLGLLKGSVTPMGIINNNGDVIILIDSTIKNKKILVHPNTNTATININYEDLIKFINYFGNKYIEL